MAPAPGGTEKELHQLHSLLSQTYRVGTSAQDPAVDECIRLSLKLADDILSETTNGTTPNGETLPPTSAGTVSGPFLAAPMGAGLRQLPVQQPLRPKRRG